MTTLTSADSPCTMLRSPPHPIRRPSSSSIRADRLGSSSRLACSRNASTLAIGRIRSPASGRYSVTVGLANHRKRASASSIRALRTRIRGPKRWMSSKRASRSSVASHNGTTGSSHQVVGYTPSCKARRAEPHDERSRSMGNNTRFVGLDVHAETIAVAVAEGRNQVRSLGTIANRPEAVRRLLGKLGKLTELRVCYEAGPTGYALYWELTRLGVQCEVIAPSLVPMKSGDRIKTDRRDAERLARSYQAGDLTPVWVPDSKHEALRDLVRAREATKEDQLRAKHRLGKYLLRYGQRPADGCKAWTAAWWQWLRALQLPHAEQNTTLVELVLEVDHQGQRIERFDAAIDRAVDGAPEQLRAIVDALQALRGVAKVTAV